MRSCDYCGQSVQDEAVYCRFCQRELTANPDLAGKRRCPTCAEWIDRGAVICPQCDHSVSVDPALGKPSRMQRLAAEPKAYDPREILKEKPEKKEAPPRAPFRRQPEAEHDTEAEFGVEETSGIYPPLRKASPFTASPREQDPFSATPFKKAFWERKGGKGESPTTPPNPFTAAPPEPAAGIFGAIREPAVNPAPPRRIGPLIRTALVVVAVAALAILVGPTLVRRGGPWIAGLMAPGTPVATDGPATGEPVAPTATTLVVATAVPPSPTPPLDCVSWETVTTDDAGTTLCAFGIIRRRFAQGDIPFVAIFDEDQGTFMIIDRLGWHAVEPGDCIRARGTVELMRQTRPVIDAQGTLERCD